MIYGLDKQLTLRTMHCSPAHTYIHVGNTLLTPESIVSPSLVTLQTPHKIIPMEFPLPFRQSKRFALNALTREQAINTTSLAKVPQRLSIIRGSALTNLLSTFFKQDSFASTYSVITLNPVFFIDLSFQNVDQTQKPELHEYDSSTLFTVQHTSPAHRTITKIIKSRAISRQGQQPMFSSTMKLWLFVRCNTTTTAVQRNTLI